MENKEKNKSKQNIEGCNNEEKIEKLKKGYKLGEKYYQEVEQNQDIN